MYPFFSLQKAVINEQVKLRENAISQSNAILEIKRAIIQFSRASKSDSGPSMLSAIVGLLTEPLSKARKDDQDHLVIELVLHFIRNLLCSEPVIQTSKAQKESSLRLQEDLISVFHQELVLDIVLVLSQQMHDATSEDAHYNLLLMEIIHHLIKHADPIAVAKSTGDPKTIPLGNGLSASVMAPPVSLRDKSTSISLRSVLSKERQRLRSMAAPTTRHANFGGTLVKLQAGNKRKILSSASPFESIQLGGPAKSGGKKSTPFVSESNSNKTEGMAKSKTNNGLNQFCAKFVSQGYKPLMKSLKNEFRRESGRLETQDRIVFFKIVWFFSRWQRVTNTVKCTSLKVLSTNMEKENNQSTLNAAQYEHLAITMDLFTFQMVMTAIDHYLQQKKYYELSQSVALYVELMHILYAMMHISKDEVENVMSLGVQYKLFYDDEPLDHLPVLLRAWQEGVYAKEYVCDLVELCHLTLKLMEGNIPGSSESVSKKSRRKSRKKQDDSKDRVAIMKEEAAEFNINGYVGSLATSPKIVTGMYAHLLGRYAKNAPHINHHIVSFYLRVCRFPIYSPEGNFSDSALQEFDQACNQAVTLEPVLYNVKLFGILSEILNDASIRGNQEFSALRQFAGTIIRHFCNSAKKNPLLVCEMLLKNYNLADHCERVTNLYADEDVRTIVAKAILYDDLQQSSNRTANAPIKSKSKSSNKPKLSDPTSNDDEESEDEAEFDDAASEDESVDTPTKTTREKFAKLQEEDDNDDKWNGRRKFVPKRAQLEATNKDENLGPDKYARAEATVHKTTKKRLSIAVESDSDSDSISNQSTQLIYDGTEEQTL